MIYQNPVQKVRAFLRVIDPALEPVEYPDTTKTAAEAARVLGVEVGQIAKSLLFRCGDRYGLFVLAGDMRMAPQNVKKLLGGGKTRMATPEEVEEITGFKIGGVCPFALRTPVPIFLDRSMQRFERVYAAAGSAFTALPITFEQLQAVTGGEVIDTGKTPVDH